MALFQRFRVSSLHDLTDLGAAPASGPRSAGEMLRQQREALGLELRDVAAALRIKPDYLAALEAGRLDLLPGPAYASGFVRAYGKHLKLDGNEMLRRFKSESAALDTKPDLAFPMPLGERSMPQRSMLLVALILALCGYGTWYYLATGERTHPERVAEVPDTLLPATEPSAGSTVLPTAAQPGPESQTARSAEAGSPPSAAPYSDSTRTVGSTGASAAVPPSTAPPPSAAVSAPLPAAAVAASSPPAVSVLTDPAPKPRDEGSHTSGATADSPARVVIRATADSWIQIREPGQPPLFTGVLKAGESYRVPDHPGVTMRTGNAGGLEITVDGQTTPPLGPNGAVRNVRLEPQSLIVGTAGSG